VEEKRQVDRQMEPFPRGIAQAKIGQELNAPRDALEFPPGPVGEEGRTRIAGAGQSAIGRLHQMSVVGGQLHTAQFTAFANDPRSDEASQGSQGTTRIRIHC
jgi:hypothetical protein